MEPLVMVAAIVEHDQKILLIKRPLGPYEGRMMLPCGYIEWNEHAVHAAQRVVKEQTGLDFAPSFLFYKDQMLLGAGTHEVVLVFHGKGTGTLTVRSGSEQWVSEDMVKRLHLAFDHLDILKDYFKQKVLVAR